jgi:hypothetical protein
MEGKKRKSQASSSLGLAFITIIRGSRESIWQVNGSFLVRDLFAGKADIAALFTG